MWRQLWVLVVVGVAGGVRKEGEGFFFTATALSEVRSGGELEVLLTLEKSLHPNVTFDLSLRSLDLGEFSDEEEWAEDEEVLARKRVTLEVNELRRVFLRVSDLPWRTADLVVTALQTGHSETGRQISTRIQKVSPDVEAIVETEESSYARGDTVNYRALVVDKTPKFAQVILKNVRSLEETLLPWVEVPESGIVAGNFTFDSSTDVEVRVSSDVTSSESLLASSRQVSVYYQRRRQPSHFMDVKFHVTSDISCAQPRMQGRVWMKTAEGFPLDGNCNVTLLRKRFGDEIGTRRVAVGLAGGDFEFDLVEELGVERECATLRLEATCSDFDSGSVVEVAKKIDFSESSLSLRMTSVKYLRRGNSSHPQTTVVLSFLVDRWDGDSVEEEEPSKELHVELLLSEKNLERLRPSATNFSLPIPPNGRVRLEFQVNDTPPAPWNDSVRMKVGDTEAEDTLKKTRDSFVADMRVMHVDPAQLIRRGDVVRFRVVSCEFYDNVNAILYSHKAIYSSQRFSFSPEDYLDGVIELTIPQNVTEGSLNLLVYGLAYGHAERASVKVNVVPSHEQQYIRIVDQEDVDMSTKVTFRLEGLLADSVVSLEAGKLKEHEVKTIRPFNCRNPIKPENPGIVVRDNSPIVDTSNSYEDDEKPSYRHPPLVFIDVDRKISTEDNGTFTVTRTFDRFKEFGTYGVSGATFNSKSGRTVFSNSPVFEILPPPVTLSVFVEPYVPLGKTVQVLGYVKNNVATPFEGHVVLRSQEGESTKVMEEFIKVKANAYKIVKMHVTPQMIGDFFVSLSSNISSRLTATKKGRVFLKT